jgi:hypothetical protein
MANFTTVKYEQTMSMILKIVNFCQCHILAVHTEKKSIRNAPFQFSDYLVVLIALVHTQLEYFCNIAYTVRKTGILYDNKSSF